MARNTDFLQAPTEGFGLRPKAILATKVKNP